MRIGFDAAPVFSSFSGIGQYVRSLFSAMMAAAPEIEWVGFVPPGCPDVPPSLMPHPLVSYRSKGLTLQLRGLTGIRNSLDIYHGTNFKAPNFGQSKSVLTIHDLWLTRNPQYSKKFFGQGVSSWRLGRRAARMSKVIAVSQFSAREIHEIFGVPREQIAVIYHGCSSNMYLEPHVEKFQEFSQRFGFSGKPYVLFVGGAEPRKNHRTLFQAFASSRQLAKNFCLVAVGDTNTRGENLFRTASELGISKNVYCPGLVTEEELRALYSFAHVFVFPSFYEGFGIPVLEAMACGAPVVAANCAALPEIAGEAAIYVNPQNVEELAFRMEQFLGDHAQQALMRERGFQHVRQFTWDRAAKETLSVYREVIASHCS